MAKVSLRNYDREIEGFIDQNRLDEAIAHSRHILQTYPKHLDTYRLLGKAFLEAKRFEEAVDVFTRVLSSVPDDFVSHVGMSIIRDEQGRLDDAIAHMERAFETQPSNAAIQNELRRLFGRRDGIQPTKIRMNRGALAHMYVQGELYPQAISEIKAVLAADSQRMDMRTLLARAYFHAGQRADASEACAQILETHPYSLDANRIMSELMQGTESPAASQVYRDRVSELDPYAAYSPSSIFRSSEAPEVAVSLEHLEYHGPDMEPAPEWKPAGIGEAAPDEQPEWLKRDYSSPQEPPAPQLEPKNDLPEFMRAAGWTPTSGETAEPEPLTFGSEETEPADLAPGDMPDWLKAMAPQEEHEEPPVIPTPPVTPLQAGEIPDWLSAAAPGEADATRQTPTAAAAPGPTADLPDWLQGMASGGTETPETPAPPVMQTPGAEIPDWLSDMTPPAETPVTPADQPAAWMESQTPEEPEASMGPVVTPEPTEASAEAIEVPVAAPVDDTPDWLKKLSAEAEEPVSDIPDWLQNIEAAEPGLAPSSVEASLPDWLEPEAPEAPVAAPSMREPEPIEDEFPPVVAPVEPLTPPPSLESLGTSMKEQDDALAWLESLAAKHGAKAEELVSDPNARTDKPPEWVQQARALSEGQPIAAQPPLEETQPVFLEPEPEPEQPAYAAEPVEPVFLELEPEQPAYAAEPVEPVFLEPEQPVEAPQIIEPVEPAMPESPYMQPLEPIAPELEGSIRFEEIEAARMIEPGAQIPAEEEPTLEPFVPTTFPAAADETGIWLRSLDQKEAAGEPEEMGISAEFIESIEQAEPLTKAPEPVEAEETAAEPVMEAAAEIAVPVEEEASDLPDWLQDIDREEEKWSAVPISETLDEEIPAWLQGEAEPAAEAEPTAPGEWRPAEIAPEAEPAAPEIEAEPVAEKPEEKIPFWQKKEAGPAAEAEPVLPSEPEPAPVPERAEEKIPFWLKDRSEPAEELEPAAPAPEPSQEYLQEMAALREQPQEAEPQAVEMEAEAEVEPGLQQEAQIEPPHFKEPSPAPVSQPVEPPAAPRRPSVRPVERRPAAAAAQMGEPALALARAEMNRGSIPSALDQYERLIKRGKYLEETIHDMREALYRYPVEVSIWQTLGDAYMRENRLQEALDAYTKAEELLR